MDPSSVLAIVTGGFGNCHRRDPLEPGGLTPKHLWPQRAWTRNIPDHLREAVPTARDAIRIESPKEVRITLRSLSGLAFLKVIRSKK